MKFFTAILAALFPKKIVPASQTYTPKRMTFIDYLISYAKKEIGVVETSRNQGAGIEKYWLATDYGSAGYTNREPYCAAFMCWLFMKAAGDYKVPFSLPKSAGVLRWLEWAQKHTDTVKVLPVNTKVLRGDIVLFDFNGKSEKGSTHIGLAWRDEENGKCFTIEANTSISDAGSQSDGGGVHEKTRTKKYMIHVLRLSL